MVEAAIEECERFYPVFQFVLWGGKSPQRSHRRGTDRDARGGLMGMTRALPPDLVRRLRQYGRRDARRLARGGRRSLPSHVVIRPSGKPVEGMRVITDYRRGRARRRGSSSSACKPQQLDEVVARAARRI